MSKSEFISSLWYFDTLDTSKALTHNLYRWYGKLPPQLVSKVLNLYTKTGDSIIANFSGSGTIALESMIKGINCIGTDINPLALLISKVKTTPIKIENLENLILKITKTAKTTENSVSISHLYQPSKWYAEADAYKLVALKKAIEKIEDNSVQDFFLAVLASITRDCSKIDSRCVNHIVHNKSKKTLNVYEHFIQTAHNSYKQLETLNNYKQPSSIKFLNHTAADMTYAQDNSIDLVFSHPPYLNAINYYNIYRLSTDLLEMDYDKIRTNDFSAKNLNVFLSFMEQSFKESYRVLKKGKHCVIVIGDTRFHGNLITLQSDFIGLLKKSGFVIEDIFIWEMTRKAGMNVARRGNYIDHNYVIVAKKEN